MESRFRLDTLGWMPKTLLIDYDITFPDSDCTLSPAYWRLRKKNKQTRLLALSNGRSFKLPSHNHGCTPKDLGYLPKLICEKVV